MWCANAEARMFGVLETLPVGTQRYEKEKSGGQTAGKRSSIDTNAINVERHGTRWSDSYEYCSTRVLEKAFVLHLKWRNGVPNRTKIEQRMKATAAFLRSRFKKIDFKQCIGS